MELQSYFGGFKRLKSFNCCLHYLKIGNLVIYFSFETPVGFEYREPHNPIRKIADDFWGKHTHYHLKVIDHALWNGRGFTSPKNERVSREYLDFKIRQLVKKEIDTAVFPWDHYGRESVNPLAIWRRGEEWFGGTDDRIW